MNISEREPAPRTGFEEAKYERTQVYLEDRYEKPKHLFTVLADRILALEKSHGRLLDVGAATGEFGYYLKKRAPELKITCLEYDRTLLEHGKMRVPNCEFVWGDANNLEMFNDDRFDVVTMIGVLSIFDDFVPSLRECIRVTKPHGVVFVATQFNEYPIDVLIRWRYSGDTGAYNRGWNLFSKKSIGDFLQQETRVRTWEFEKFVLPFDLPQQPDLIRTWTELDRNGDRIFKNGLQMLINLQILTITLK